MRAPFQEGDFPGPVKYGYLNVGVVEQGPPELRGRTVFCLYPHQTAYVVPAGAVPSCPTTCRRRGRCSPAPWRPPSTRCGTPHRCSATGSPSSVPAWSAAASRGCSPVPGCPGHAGRRRPGRAEVAAALGVDFALPADAADGRDLVVHTSATSAGLQRSLDLLAPEGTVIDLSWYGDTEVRLSLGGAFHSAAQHPGQPGRHGLARPPRAPHHGRPAGARARAAARPCLRRADHRASRFDELPEVMARLAAGSLPALCHTITYGEG